jgi:hypothetical protein
MHKTMSERTRLAINSVVLIGVPVLALSWFSPWACQGLGAVGPALQARITTPQGAAANDNNNVLTAWSDTQTDASTLNPDASDQANKFAQQITQMLAALQTQAVHQTDPVKQGVLLIEATALKTNMQQYDLSIANNTTAQGLSPYNYAHARSIGLHQEIGQLRLAVKGLTSPITSTLVAQILNLRYEEATALDKNYKILTGRHASPTTILNFLVSFDSATATADATARTAQTQELATGVILPANASPFTFSNTF